MYTPMTEPMVPQPSQVEALKLFNDFQAQGRARTEATLKLLMVLAGGMLTLSVGAVLGSSPAKIPASFVGALTWSWRLFFYTIAASTLVMVGILGATFHMGVRWRKHMESPSAGTYFVVTWGWLRILNVALAASALISFLVGVVLISQVAVGVA